MNEEISEEDINVFEYFLPRKFGATGWFILLITATMSVCLTIVVSAGGTEGFVNVLNFITNSEYRETMGATAVDAVKTVYMLFVIALIGLFIGYMINYFRYRGELNTHDKYFHDRYTGWFCISNIASAIIGGVLAILLINYLTNRYREKLYGKLSKSWERKNNLEKVSQREA